MDINFKKREYIVILFDQGRVCEDTDFPSFHCFKQREDARYLLAEKDNSGSTTNGWGIISPNKDRYTWRNATQEEIDYYNKVGKPFNVKEMNWSLFLNIKSKSYEVYE